MATEICNGAWQRSVRPRNHRLEIYNNERMPTTTHREFADEAAEHRARRRWIDHERATNPNFPQGDNDNASTTATTTMPPTHAT
eukprot:9458414-Pyramimonas_sp.AAC.1